MDKNDIAISPRITDFNVQISAVNIHSHCSQMFRQNYKFILSLYYCRSGNFLRAGNFYEFDECQKFVKIKISKIYKQI